MQSLDLEKLIAITTFFQFVSFKVYYVVGGDLGRYYFTFTNNG